MEKEIKYKTAMKPTAIYEIGDYMIEGENTYTCTDVQPVKDDNKCIITYNYTFKQVELLKCKNAECGSIKLHIVPTDNQFDFICMDCNFISTFTYDEMANKQWNPTIELPANQRIIDVEADELINKINEVYPLEENGHGTIQDSRGYLFKEIVEFVRRNNK